MEFMRYEIVGIYGFLQFCFVVSQAHSLHSISMFFNSWHRVDRKKTNTIRKKNKHTPNILIVVTTIFEIFKYS